MSDERIDSIVNRPKIQSDIDFLNDLLSKVMDKIKDINNFKNSFDPGKGFSDTAKQAQAAAQAADQFAESTKKLATAQKAMESALNNIDQKWRDGQGTIEENIKLQIQYESQIKKVNDVIKSQIKDIGNRGGAIPNGLIQLREEQQRIKLAMAEVNQTLKAQLKEVNAVESSYDAMNHELGQMRDLFRQLNAEERNSPFGQTLKKNIGVLDTELKRIDAELGNFQRNVGNYKSGWNGLGNSINQITRELPAFTVSAQTGFLAISNNLPILFDEISKTKNEIKSLRVEGQKVPGLFNQLAKSIFSWGTALSLGVTLLTIYGKDVVKFFGNLFKGKEVMDGAVESQRLLNKALENGSGEYQSAVKSVDSLRINIDLAKRGFLDKEKVVKQYNESIGKTTGQVDSLEEAEQGLIKNADAYVKMMLYKSAANLALEEAAKKAFEAERERQKSIDEFVTTGSRSLEGLQGGFGTTLVPGANSKELAERNRKKRAADSKSEAIKEAEDQKKVFEDIAKKLQSDAANIAKNNNFDFFSQLTTGESKKGNGKDAKEKVFEEGDAIRKANFEIQKQLLSDQQTFNKQIVNNDGEAFLQRTEAAKKYLATTLAINKLEYEYNVSGIDAKEKKDTEDAKKEYTNAKEREKAIKYITDAAKAERTAALNKFNSDQAKINTDYQNGELKKLEDYLNKDLSLRERFEADVQKTNENQLKSDYDRELADLDASFAKKEISEKAYNDKKLELQLAYQIELLNMQIEFAKKQINILEKVADASGDPVEMERVRKAKINLANLETKLIATVASFQIQKSKEIAAEEENKLKERSKKYEEFAKNIKDISGKFIEGVSAIGDLLNAKNERELNTIQEQIDAIEKKKKTEIEAIEASTASEEEKAAKISILNARSAAQQNDLAIKQRQVKQRQARFDKAIAVASIIQDTAVAVVKALGSAKPPANFIAAAAVGALGAVKLAAAIATPIPQYAEGVGVNDDKSHPGGLAVVGDGGKKELVVTPSGRTYITPNKSTLVSMPKGSRVFPDANQAMETVKNVAFRNMPISYVTESNYSNEMTMTLAYKLDNIANTIRNKRENHFKVTHAGMNLNQKMLNNYITWVNSNMQS